MNDSKAAARTAAFARRKMAFAAGQGQAAEILADVLGAHQGKTLAGYMPMRTEIDPLPAMAAHQGLVGVPVIRRVKLLKVNPAGNPETKTVSGVSSTVVLMGKLSS